MLAAHTDNCSLASLYLNLLSNYTGRVARGVKRSFKIMKLTRDNSMEILSLHKKKVKFM